MTSLIPFLDPVTIGFALMIGFCAGFVKGVVGFAMPLVMLSGLTVFITPELALAGLILPTLITNMMQSMRQGVSAAMESVRKFRVFLITGGVTLVVAAQFVRLLPEQAFQLTIGIPVVIFALLQLTGYQFQLARQDWRIEGLVGSFAGVFGGLAGIWGPPTVAYLTALDTPKYDQMRVQGVIYGAGSALLFVAHLGSGVLRGETMPFAVLLVIPAILGMWVGGQVMDRIDQKAFRRATLVVLIIAGGNLIRRGLF